MMGKNSSLLIGANGVALVARIVSTMVLTRLLDATAFGAVGMVMSFSFIVVMLTDLGFYAFVVRSPRAHDPDFLDRVWTVRLCRDAALTLVFIALSKPLAWYVEVPGLAPAFAVGALTLILDGLSSMAFATAARDQRIGLLSLLDLIPALASIVVSIGVSIVIRNYWAIICGICVGSLLKTILSYGMFPGSRRRFVIDRQTFRDVWAFGRFVMPSSIITLLINQSDKLVLARAFDLKTFGLYSLASNLASAPLSLMASYTSRILYPAFSTGHREHPGVMAEIFYSTGFAIRMAFMFLCGGAITAAPIAIALLYDDRYLGASEFLSVLMITSLINFVITTENELLVAVGEVKKQLYFNGLRIVLIGVIAPIFYVRWGAIGLVWSFAISGMGTQAAVWIKMRAMGIFRLRGEIILWSAVLAGMSAGYAAVLLAQHVWTNIPSPFRV